MTLTPTMIAAAIDRVENSRANIALTFTETDMLYDTISREGVSWCITNNVAMTNEEVDLAVAVALAAYRRAISDVQELVHHKAESLTSY